MPSTPIRLAVLVSGGGTSLQNLIDRIRDGRLHAHIALVVSSKPNAFALERARQASIPTAIVERKQAGSNEAFSRQIFDCAGSSRSISSAWPGFCNSCWCRTIFKTA